jgi:hypothetical protein
MRSMVKFESPSTELASSARLHHECEPTCRLFDTNQKSRAFDELDSVPFGGRRTRSAPI